MSHTYPQDHKAVGNGDTGPNTGGMGTYSPAPVVTDAVTKQTMDEIMWRTARAMVAEGAPFKGTLFAGLMIKDGKVSPADLLLCCILSCPVVSSIDLSITRLLTSELSSQRSSIG